MKKNRLKSTSRPGRRRRPPLAVWLTAVGICLISNASRGLAAAVPVAVSPGGASERSLISDPCPTFSWGAVDEVEQYELLVVRVDDEGEEVESALRQSVVGSALSWTPSVDRCLERGGGYAWSVRAIGRTDASEWSPPSLFQVVARSSESDLEEALSRIHEYLAGEAEAGGFDQREHSEPTSQVPPRYPERQSRSLSSASSALAGDPGLQVNGSPVVTLSTLGGALCAVTEIRFLDQGDGTVLDCNTGLVILKDADCLGAGTWDDTAPFDLGSAQSTITLLNASVEFNCRDYAAGTYTDWRLPEMDEVCGLWDGSCSGSGCCTAGEGIIDPAYSGPAIANAREDAQWVEEDAFVGPLPVGFWTASEDFANGNNAWLVFVSSGDPFSAEKNQNVSVWPVRDGQ